jgi:hypothetical protein
MEPIEAPIVLTNGTRFPGVSDPPGRGRDGRGHPRGGSLTPQLTTQPPPNGRHKTPPPTCGAHVFVDPA